MEPLSTQSLILAFVAAAALCALSAPLFASLARRIGLVVAPRADRWHARATPLLGGGGLGLATLAILGVTLPQTLPAAAVLVGAVGALALGLFDDIRRIAPSSKLAGQAMLGSFLALAGVKVEIVDIAPVAFVLTILWVVAIMNAVNLIDNMDGLAAGVCAIAAGALGIAAVGEAPLASIVALTTAGACVGFLVHNFSPARIFMGDAGSMLLGFLLAAAGLLHTASGAANVGVAVFVPVVLLALPIFDSAFVATLRRRAGRPISQGGRDHTSHRLAALGLSDRGAVLVLYLVTAVFAAVVLVGEVLTGLAVPLGILALVGLILLGVLLAEVDVYGRAEATVAPRAGRGFTIYGRFGAEIALDVTLLTVAYHLAFTLRFEGLPQAGWLPVFTQTVPIVVTAQLAALAFSGTYRTLWRYLGLGDVVAVTRALTLGSLVAAAVIIFGLRPVEYSRGMLALDWVLALALLVGSRAFLIWLRQWFASLPRSGERRVLIIGASDAGALALRLLARARDANYRAVGFLDDDPGKRYRRLSGVPIVGTIADLDSAIRRYRIDVVLYANEWPVERSLLEALRMTSAQLGAEWREVVTAPTGIRPAHPA